ncbi:hypothetical protein A2733_01020 [Candidatus Nomurabacteria bacterium RIFCSPHIGHO2_01_FULL_40_20]|uniref:GIY-YIG domain-containing protein n=1 Tax=Candidatus Nomurabacteria bacterium RIFCSPHIGHO2_01_FULL_40_20 TaxID=1801738 RepID=A0A1F6V3H2_9BACT|nr:MAG: hypothetical protein A2733_01020 [Candidatus Nomurabacteria bacterium RIFCSPHIGHO2_01_FULL_40_20]
MYWVYLLEDQNDKSWYIGYTSDLKKRLAEHINKQGGKTTSKKDALKLIYYEGYLNQTDAKGGERFLKSGAGRKYVKKQLANYLET